MGTVEHHACREQSRTERNPGIDGSRADPAASPRSFIRDNHRSGALTATLSTSRGSETGGTKPFCGPKCYRNATHSKIVWLFFVRSKELMMGIRATR